MFRIDMEFMRGMLFVRLEGILSKRTSKQLNEVLDQMIYEQGIRYFVINLENLKLINEDGIQSIMNHYLLIEMYDGKLVICGYHHKLRKQIRNEVNLIFQSIESSHNELGAFRLIHV